MVYFIVNCICVLFCVSATFASEIFYVGKGENYTSIKSALSKATKGDRIILKKGNYQEGEIIIDKEIELIGEDSPKIDGNNTYQPITIKANNVTIKGITVVNSKRSYINDFAAVKAMNVRNLTINNCHFSNNYFAVYLSKCSNCTIKNNLIESSSESETTSGNGIHQWYCDSIDIQDNTIRGHRDGIYLEFSHHAFIRNNISEKNLRYGLHFMFSDSCTYIDNTFRNNGSGVAVMYTKHITMIHNKFEHNWGSASYGMLLKEIYDSYMQGNTFTENTVGIFAESCNRNLIKGNEFTRNGWAIKVYSSSSENSFVDNNFSGNSFNVSTNGTHNTNTFNGNYWSEYNGYDINHDGIGDVPFRPVRLFSLLIEKQPPALILLRSIFVDVMDIAERIMPSLTPETLIDNEPKMKPNK
ncbi:MAG: nitrous oxide reductase family maturation protein NosD [Bacteroidetes bacterium]|nr:nitrous oxide reductase family maturation protein NosD [Bacteroidota bacterium]